jgi:hypothetical protein
MKTKKQMIQKKYKRVHGKILGGASQGLIGNEGGGLNDELGKSGGLSLNDEPGNSGGLSLNDEPGNAVNETSILYDPQNPGNSPTTGGKILYYIIGPVTEKDITLIEEYNANSAYTDIVVVLQGGIDPDTTKEWSTTLMGALPANAGMNPGQKFFQDKMKQRGWYDLLDSAKLKSLDKVSVICQTTNSAKPGFDTKDPRNTVWKQLYDDEFFNQNTQFTSIKNLIKMYDEFTGAPWQHDPIAVIHSISLLIPGFFENDPLLEMFDTNSQHIDFTNNLDGIITESSINFAKNRKDIVDTFFEEIKGKGNIYVVPYKENKIQMKDRGEIRKKYLFKLLEELTDKPTTTIESPFKKIICSLEIYDPDNLLALKCIQGLSKKLNVELDVIVHYQKYPKNIKFIKNVVSLFNYLDESTFDKQILNESIENVKHFNDIKDDIKPSDLLQYFTGIIPAFTGELNKVKTSPFNKYISGFLMYSQLRNEFKSSMDDESLTYIVEETDFINWLLNGSNVNGSKVNVPKVNVIEGSVYGGMNGYTISLANVLHPISMFTKEELDDTKLNIPKIIKKCINTSVLNTERVSNINSWNETRKIKEDNNDIFDINHPKRINPTNIFHWNILDPGTCNSGSVQKYYPGVVDDEYYRKTNIQRMGLIADKLVDELNKGSIIMLQEYSKSQHDILKEKIIGKLDLETKEAITESNINNYMHYVYGSKFPIPDETPPVFVDQGLLIASFIKFDRKDYLYIPLFKPVIYVQIGDTMYATTHYNASEGSDSQSINNEIIHEQLQKLFKIKKNIYFSCDMNKSVDGTPNSVEKYEFDGETYPFIEENINMKEIGYVKPKDSPPYTLDPLNLVIQTNVEQLTTVPILFTIRRYMGPVKNELTNEIIHKSNDKISGRVDSYINTAPAKKIDGIYSIQPSKNKVEVITNTNDSLFLSDHFPLTLELNGDNQQKVIEEPRPGRPKPRAPVTNQNGTRPKSRGPPKRPPPRFPASGLSNRLPGRRPTPPTVGNTASGLSTKIGPRPPPRFPAKGLSTRLPNPVSGGRTLMGARSLKKTGGGLKKTMAKKHNPYRTRKLYK